MKKVVRAVDKCENCPWCHNGYELICTNPDIDGLINRPIENKDDIPGWCPLEDFGE